MKTTPSKQTSASEDRLVKDHPIATPKEDLFGVSSFATALAKSLTEMSPEEGLVISVEGPWGAGKSSAIALALREVMLTELTRGGSRTREELEALNPDELDDIWEDDAARSTHIVSFNPWYFSGQENLVRAFFSELASALGVQPEGKLTRLFGAVADYLPSVSAFAGGALSLATGGIAAAAAGTGAGRALGEGAQQALARDTSLEKAKRDLDKALREANQRIIVVIDDIDRLLPGEMRAIFSLLKSLGDLPNIFYVIAFDDSVVRKALKKKKIDTDFLEKIVQVSLKLPPPWRAELRTLLFSRLDAVIGDESPADQQRWQTMFNTAIDPFLKTPRDVFRLSNTLQVIWPNVVGDVDFTDLVALTTLQLFEPDVYGRLRDEIELLTDAEAASNYMDDKEIGKRYAPEKAANPAAAAEALARLFPKLARAWNKFISSDNYLKMREQRRICTAEYCRNYFLFGRDARRLSRVEIELLIKAEKPATLLQETIDRLAAKEGPATKPVATFLEQLAEAVSSKPVLSEGFLNALLDLSDELIRRQDIETRLFIYDNGSRLTDILNAGFEPHKHTERMKLLNVLLTHPTALTLPSDFVDRLVHQRGMYGGELHISEEANLFSDVELAQAVNAISLRFRKAADDGTLWDTPVPMRLIWRWQRWNADEVQDWFVAKQGDPELALRLGAALPTVSVTSTSKGQHVYKKFDRGWIEKFISVDTLFEQLKAMAEAAGPHSKEAEILRELEEAEENARRPPHERSR
ncbi:hypothetical protein AMST5_02151 [freshwater sediment metagenome]|uniref:KAP NTPase domain-containing protein n=1 Tax=freshwater sediment metagenome TaxID=556182 RepID=A0AA48LZN3_9ZZZZ